MEKRFDEVIDEIKLKLNPGYEIDHLDKVGRREFNAYVMSICDMETAFDNLPCMMDESIIGGIQQEVAQRTYEHVYEYMVCNAVNLVYSLLDDQEEKNEG